VVAALEIKLVDLGVLGVVLRQPLPLFYTHYKRAFFWR
jgi:hypothetical protein